MGKLKKLSTKLDFFTTKAGAKVMYGIGAIQYAALNIMTAHANGTQASGSSSADLSTVTTGFQQVYEWICQISIVVAGVTIAANLLIGMFGGEKTIEKSKTLVKWIIGSAIVINVIGLVLNFAIGMFGGQGQGSQLQFN